VFAKDLRPELTVQEVKDLGIGLLFQPPGYMVVTPPDVVYHWTISLGFSVAEASNTFLQLPDGVVPADLWSRWKEHSSEVLPAPQHVRKTIKERLGNAEVFADNMGLYRASS